MLAVAGETGATPGRLGVGQGDPAIIGPRTPEQLAAAQHHSILFRGSRAAPSSALTV
jgi:hypothetical protein